ncbi:hypothetical protein LTS18_013304, partial [Coniosporium uncinatum]
MVLMKCHQLSACETGTRNHSKYVSTRLRGLQSGRINQVLQELTSFPRPSLTQEVKDRLVKPMKANGRESKILSQTTHNPSVKKGQYTSAPAQRNSNGSGHGSAADKNSRRYYFATDDGQDWPPELGQYNIKFSDALEKIKRRHDGVVTTVAQGILEWKRKRQRMQIDQNIQGFLDRFYMSRIGIRMLIGQHIALTDQRAR